MFHGFGFTSDESPPSSVKYSGLRFQITYVHWLAFYPVSTWDDSRFLNAHPFSREHQLCDIFHCPGKTGLHVLKIIEQQIQTKGLTRLDMLTGTGDGGGENEGPISSSSMPPNS